MCFNEIQLVTTGYDWLRLVIDQSFKRLQSWSRDLLDQSWSWSYQKRQKDQTGPDLQTLGLHCIQKGLFAAMSGICWGGSGVGGCRLYGGGGRGMREGGGSSVDGGGVVNVSCQTASEQSLKKCNVKMKVKMSIFIDILVLILGFILKEEIKMKSENELG